MTGSAIPVLSGPSVSRTTAAGPACWQCGRVLPAAYSPTTEQELLCPQCGMISRVWTFAEIVRPHLPTLAQPVGVDGTEAACFFHEQRRAVAACADCGRFICSLCDLPLSSEHCCPSCFASAKVAGPAATLLTSRTNYDSIALGLAVWPLVIFPFTFLTAPCALYIALRHRPRPNIVPRTPLIWSAALVLSGVECLGWGWMATYLFLRRA